jgi:hypothetical protein
MSWGAQNRPKDAKTHNVGPAMSEKPIFCQLFNKSTPPPARPSDLKLADWKPGINLLKGPLKQKQGPKQNQAKSDRPTFPPFFPLFF